VAVVFRFRITVPLVPPPLRSVPAVTPVIVPLPVPGNVCPTTKLISPVPPMLRPVSVGFAFASNNRFNVADGLTVLLPVGSACH
jgi:hypothetical protein